MKYKKKILIARGLVELLRSVDFLKEILRLKVVLKSFLKTSIKKPFAVGPHGLAVSIWNCTKCVFKSHNLLHSNEHYKLNLI